MTTAYQCAICGDVFEDGACQCLPVWVRFGARVTVLHRGEERRGVVIGWDTHYGGSIEVAVDGGFPAEGFTVGHAHEPFGLDKIRRGWRK